MGKRNNECQVHLHSPGLLGKTTAQCPHNELYNIDIPIKSLIKSYSLNPNHTLCIQQVSKKYFSKQENVRIPPIA